MSSIYRYIFSVSLLLAVALAPAQSIAQSNVKRVLVLNAYHEGYHWTDRIMKGIRSVFDREEDIEIFVNYMDTKRSSDQEYFSKLRDLYAHKYRALKFDAIVSSDDHALNFLLKYRDDLFPGVPVFFSGINDFHPSRIVGHQLFTGGYESYDVSGTLDLMLKVHPKTNKIAVITDATLSGKDFRRLVEEVEPDYAGRIGFDYLNNLSIEDLQVKLRQLTEKTLVLWAIYLRTPEGRSISSEESVKMVTQNSTRPTYCIWDVVGQGVVGGKVTSPNYQGAFAAGMALKFLRGTRIEDLPVSGSPMVYLFDYNVMRKFEIDEKVLPPASVILNQPFSAYDKYKTIIWGIISFVSTLVIVILALLYYIQKRKQAEEALRESDEKFRTLADTSPLAIYMSSGVEQKAEYINPTFVKLFGYTIDEVPTAEQLWPLAYPDENYRNRVANEWQENVEHAIKTNSEIEPVEAVVTCKDGSTKNISWGFSAVGKQNWALGLDLTSRKQATEALVKYRDKLQILVDEQTCKLKEAHAELLQKERLATLGQLTATVSHELRNPLGTIQSALFSIADSIEQNEPHRSRRSLELAERSIDRCVSIIEDLNNYARVKELDISKASVDDWLKAVFDEQSIPKGISCELDLASGIKASFDQEKLRQVAVNLITNAVHALLDKKAERKHLRISTRPLDGKYEIRFEDSGVGMSDDVKEKVFEPLYSTKGFGVGLGMVIVKHIVEQHHGEINIASKTGEGTTVILRLPINLQDERKVS